MKLNKVVPTLRDILDVFVAKVAISNSVEGEESDYNFHELKPAGKFVELEKFQKGNFNLAVRENSLEWRMQKSMLDKIMRLRTGLK